MPPSRSTPNGLTDRELLWAVYEELSEVKSALDRHLSFCGEHSRIYDETISRLCKTVYGNGQVGLTTRVSMIWWIGTGVASAIAAGLAAVAARVFGGHP